ncbi:MAG: hypothetical protein E7589_00015 [Ruminococcaceae bacterium]|nr:hypothetical protein [Oscillospiraceae bacterium]
MKAFKKYTVKAVAVLLVMSMLAAMGVGLVSVSAATDVRVNVSYVPNTNGDQRIKADGIDSLAMRIKVNSAFSYYTVQLASYGVSGAKANVALYKWDFNYAKTVANPPVHQAEITVLDNQWHQQNLTSNAVAGEYLVVVKGISTTADNGCIAWFGNLTTNSISSGCVYRQGTENKYRATEDDPYVITGEMRVGFGFTGTPATNFGSLSGHPAEVNSYRVPQEGETDITQYFYRLAPTNDVVGQRIKVTAPIMGIKMAFPNWGGTSSVRISAYTWKDTYDATIASPPFATKTFSNLSDHQQCALFFTSSMTAGEYFFAAESLSPEQPTAIYYVTDNSVSKGYSYIDGAEMRNDLCMQVYFTGSAPSTPFEDCTGYDDTTSGTATPPEQWQLPADSLINTHKVQPDTWVFTDGLGRESVQYGDIDTVTGNSVNAVNSDKTLAMFYWNWHLAHNKAKATKVLNIQEFIEKYPEAKNLAALDSTITDENGNTIAPWDKSTSYAWNEPLYGHYSTDDEWVLRRHAELLANAGVDVVFTDNSNTVTAWEDGYDLLFQNWTKAQESGVNAPKISFYFPMYTQEGGNPSFGLWTTEQLEYFYMDVFQRGKYQNLWFWFDGKPMVVAYQRELDTTDMLQKEIKNFFTFRAGVSSYDYNWRGVDVTDPADRIGYWGWSAVYPQPTFHASTADIAANKVEQMTVSVAQNYNYSEKTMTAMNGYYVTGRSYTSDKAHVLTNTPSSFQTSSENTKWGYNIGEQYEYALEVNPKVVYVTGWNEWTVVPGTQFRISGVNFADQFNDEYSRDIEPTKGALKDYYYYQLVNFSRQFQGATPMPRPNGEKTIDLNRDLESQWASVEPYFGAYIGNTMDRSEYGRATENYYTDFSGRNDIIGAQVSRDENYLYFNVECNENITPYTDKLWMNLYIDVNQSNKGWETFDYVVNKTAASAKTSVLEKFTGTGYASTKVADVEYVVDGRFMTVKIAKSDLGITGTDYTVNFAWTDNVHDADYTGVTVSNDVIYSEFSGDILDFYTSGDVAPGARFKYSYIVTDSEKLYEGTEIGNTAVSFNASSFGQIFTVDHGQHMTELSVKLSAPDDADGDRMGTGDGVLKIYAWNTNYATTVAGGALYTMQFTGKNMQWHTFEIPAELGLSGELYWEVTPTGTNGRLTALGATHAAEGVVNVINGVKGAECTHNGTAPLQCNTICAKVKAANTEYTYVYYNGINKEEIYIGALPYEALDADAKAEFDTAANKYADANGHLGFNGEFELVSFEGNVYVYYTKHTYVDTIKVNGADAALDGNHIVAVAAETDANGTPFWGWVDQNGNLLSNGSTFKFYPRSSSDTLTAVYKAGGTASVGIHTSIDRADGKLTVVVTPVHNLHTTVVEYGYFIGVDKTFDEYGSAVEGSVVASISGANKVVAGVPTSAFLHHSYSLSYESYTKDVAVVAYITYVNSKGVTYTYYANAVVSEYEMSDPDIEITNPELGDQGWL